MTVQYVSVEDAIKRGGLRMVVVGNVPSPWGEAAKGILHIKGIDWVAVRLAYDSEPLKDWAVPAHRPCGRLRRRTTPRWLGRNPPARRTPGAHAIAVADRRGGARPGLRPRPRNLRRRWTGLGPSPAAGACRLAEHRRLSRAHLAISGQEIWLPWSRDGRGRRRGGWWNCWACWRRASRRSIRRGAATMWATR